MALDDIIPNNETVSPAPGVPTDQFVFEDLPQIEIPPELDIFDENIDPKYEALLDQASIVNNYSIPAVGNMNSPYPNKATNTYDPVAQQRPPSLNDSEGVLRFMNDVSNSPTKQPDQIKIADPIASGIKSTNFDRYYSHNKFAELGWHPYADNDSYYNANSNWFDNAGRMWGQLGGLMGTGFLSPYRSVSDWIGFGGSVDDYISDHDLASAEEFSDAMAIGNSTDSGAFANNLILQSGYTFGIIGSIAAEELAIKAVQAGIALTGPAGWAADATIEGARMTRRAKLGSMVLKSVKDIGKSYANYFDVTKTYKATRDMLKNLNDVNRARQSFNAAKFGKEAGTFIARMVAPETVSAYKRLQTAKNSAQNVKNLAKTNIMFGGFYRDMRSFNLALSEAKMEAGMVYNDMISLGYSNKVYDNQATGSGDVTEEQMGDVLDKANKASFETQMWNAPMIYLTNQLVLGTAMGGFRTALGRAMSREGRKHTRGFIKTKPFRDETGKIAKDVLEDVGTGIKSAPKRIKALGVKGSAKAIGMGALRYFSANLGEGVQEVYQEAVAHGVKHYYESLLRDPLAGTVALNKASLHSAVESQLSSHGFETFMSGFLMGGIVQGPQKLVFEQGPLLYDKVFRKEKFNEYKENKNKLRETALDTLNKAYNRQADKFNSVFDTTTLKFLDQNQVKDYIGKVEDSMEDLIAQKRYDDTQFDVVDAKDYAKLKQIESVYRHGMSHLFRNQLKNMLKLDNQELAQAFPTVSKQEIKSGKARDRIQSMIDNIDDFGVIYEKNKNKFINPENPNQYEKGSRAYNDSLDSYNAYEHVRLLYLFTQDGFKRAGERAESIYGRLAAHPVLKSISARDLTVILNKDTLIKEMSTLQDEVEFLDDSDKNKKIKDEKIEKLKNLAAISEILHNEKYATKKEGKNKGAFDRRSFNKLKKPLVDYLKTIAKYNDDFVDESAIDDVLKDIIDHNHLDNRQKIYHRTIEYLNNPKVFKEIQERTYEFYKSYQKERVRLFKELIDQGILTKEINDFLNALMKDDITVDINQYNYMLQEYKNTGILKPSFLTDFYGPEGTLLNPVDDKDLYEKAIVAKEKFTSIVAPEIKETEEVEAEEKEKTEDVEKELNLQELGGISADSNPVLFEALERSRKGITVSSVLTIDNDVDSSEELTMALFLKTEEARNIVNAYKRLKEIWYNDSIRDLDIQANKKKEIRKTDKGFIEWLKVNLDNEDVEDEFALRGFNLGVFDSTYRSPVNTGETIKGYVGGLSIIEFSTLVNGEKIVSYYVKDKAGKSVFKNQIFDSKKNAEDAAKQYLEKFKDLDSYEFAGVTLSKGAVIKLKSKQTLQFGSKRKKTNTAYDEGQEFIVMATPEELAKSKGQTLFILPKTEGYESVLKETSIEKRNAKLVRVDASVFANIFDVVGSAEGYNLGDKIRLERQEATMLQPHKEPGESKEQIYDRFQSILNSLPDEEGVIELVVSTNPKAGEEQDRRISGKESNKHIKFFGQSYTIAVRLTEKGMNALPASVKKKLDAKRDQFKDIIAYVPNGDVKFYEDNGAQVNPIIMEKTLMAKVFKGTSLSDTDADNIHKSFAIQTHLIQVLDKKGIKEGETVVLTTEDLEGLGFNTTLGQMDFIQPNTQPTPIEALDYNDVDGFFVIVENTTIDEETNTRSSRLIVKKKNGKATAEEIQKITKQVKEAQNIGSASNIYQAATKGSRYQLIIKSPSGIWSFAELKSARLEPNVLNALMQELKVQAEKTQDSIDFVMTTEGKQTKKKSYPSVPFNTEFNKSFNESFFIAAKPGYTFEMKLTKDGDIQFSAFNRRTKKYEDSTYVEYEEFKDLSSEKILPLILDSLNQKTTIKVTSTLDIETGDQSTENKDKTKESVFEKFNITEDSFRGSFAESATAKEIADASTVNLNSNIRKDRKMMINIEGIDFQAAQAQAINSQAKTDEETPGKESEGPAVDEGDGLTSEGLELIKKAKNETKFTAKELVFRKQEIQTEIDDIIDEYDPGEELSDEDQKRHDKLDKEIEEINKKLKAANKIIPVSSDLSNEDVENIDIFISWASENLPDFIRIKDIATLSDNLKANGYTVGQFQIALKDLAKGLEIEGIIYTGAKNTFRYHEAFHSVFRMLLTKEQQDLYYAYAKKEIMDKINSKKGYEISPGVFAKSLTEALNLLKNSAEIYTIMSANELEKNLLEEYMADEFEMFKQNPKSTKTNSFIKSLFNRILTWIRSVFTNYKSNELRSLYEMIDSGKFKNTSIQNNKFTESAAEGITVEANKIIYKKTNTETKYLNADVASNITSQIVARVVNETMKNSDASVDTAKLIQDSFNIYKEQYSVKNTQYQKSLSREQKISLRNIDAAFKYEEGREIMTDVINQLELYDVKVEIYEDESDEFEGEYGLRNVDQYNLDASMIGGLRSIPTFLRRYMSTTTLIEKDMFGNETLYNGEKMIVPVDFSKVYSGFMKAMSGINDPVELLQSLYLFSRTNPHTKAVVDRMFTDLNLTKEDVIAGNLQNLNLNKIYLYNALIKGFTNHKVDYLFIHSFGRGENKDVTSYTAANRDDANTQVEQWGQHYETIRQKVLKGDKVAIKSFEEGVDALELMRLVLENPESMTDQGLEDMSKKLSINIYNGLGFKLSIGYIMYTIAEKIPQAQKTNNQKILVNRGLRLGQTLQLEDLIELERRVNIRVGKKITPGQIFKSDSENEGMYNRLRRIAFHNAPYDEGVGTSVFVNPNGDLVYAHQVPTLHLKTMAELNDATGAALDEILKDPLLANDPILNSPQFREMSKSLLHKIIRIAGVKTSASITQDETGFTGEDVESQGSTYGDLTKKEFMVALINAYTAGYNSMSGAASDVITVDENNREVVTNLAPVLIRVIEASNTGDLKMQPIIKSVEKDDLGRNVLTEEAKQIFVTNIIDEFNRIKKELNPNTQTKELYLGYNATLLKDQNGEDIAIRGQVDDPKLRAYGFSNIGVYISPTKTYRGRDVTLEMSIDKSEFKSLMSEEEGSSKIILSSSEPTMQENEVGIVSLSSVSKVEGKTVFNNEDQQLKLKLRSKRYQLDNNSSTYLDDLDAIVEELGDLVVSKDNRVEDVHDVRFSIKGEIFYTTTKKIAKFLQGKEKSSLAIYELTDEEIGSSGQSLDVEVDYKQKMEAILQEKAKDLNNGDITEEQYENLTIENILNDLDDVSYDAFLNFIEYRIDQEYIGFRNLMRESGIDNKDLSSFVINGINNMNSPVTDIMIERANKRYNLTNELDYNLKQIFINDLLNVKALNKLISGDEALVLKDAIDKVKRAKDRNAAIVSAKFLIPAPKLGIYKPLNEIHIFGYTEPEALGRNPKVNMYTGESGETVIEYSDGQSYGTAKGFRHEFFGYAKFDESFSKLLDKVEAGVELNKKELAFYVEKQQMMNSKKTIAATGKVMAKMSKFFLIPQLTSKKDKNGNWTIPKENAEHLHNLRINMERFEASEASGDTATIAMAMPLSGLKMMKKITLKHSDISNKNTILDPSQAMIIDADNYGLQVINPSNKIIATDPTQIKTLITSEQDLSGDTVVVINGEDFPIKSVVESYNKAISDRLSLGYVNRRNQIFNFDIKYAQEQLHASYEAGAISTNLISYLKYAQAALQSSGTASSQIDFYAIDPNTGEQEWNLNNPLTKRKFEQLFLSYFSKGVMSEKIPGISAALVSDFGFRVFRRVYSVDENGTPERQEVIRYNKHQSTYSDEDYFSIDDDDNFQNDRIAGLAEEIENAKGKGVLILDRLRFNVKEYTDPKDESTFTGIRYMESMMAAHDGDVLEEISKTDVDIPKFIADMFGIRIPSQAKHSAANVKLVDFLPSVYGSSIVSARELIEISGADFDIDKLYLHIKEYYSKLEETGEYQEIYDVVVDMYEHKTDVDITGDPVDIWVVDSLEQAQKQLDIIKSSGGGKNFGKINATRSGKEWVILHKKGDHKKIYLKGFEPKDIVKDKLRTKGEPYLKPIKRKVFEQYKDSYKDYIKYANKQVNKKASSLSEVLILTDSQIWYTNSELKKALKDGFNERSYRASKLLALPTTEEEYDNYKKSYRNPSSAVLNNEILDYKRALLGNDYITKRNPLYLDDKGSVTTSSENANGKKYEPFLDANGNQQSQIAIAYEPADVKILTDLWTELKDSYPSLAESLAEEGIDADNLRGKAVSSANNKEGARSIGAAVLPNLVMNLLTEYKSKIAVAEIDGNIVSEALEINNRVYNSFSVENEILADGSQGERKQYIISALITAMTDNAKERLAAKLGLSKNALALAVNATALGVPLKTTVLMLHNSVIKDLYYEQSLAESQDSFYNMDGEVSETIDALVSTIDELKGEAADKLKNEDPEVAVSNSTLDNLINKPLPDLRNKIKKDDFIKYANENVNELESIMTRLAQQIGVLKQFKKANTITQYTRKIGKIMNLVKGFGQDFSSFDSYRDTMVKLDLIGGLQPEASPIIDVKPIFGKESKTWQSKMLEIYADFATITPAIFTSRTIGYESIYQGALKNFIIKKTDKEKTSLDIMSYFTIKAYLKYLENKQRPHSLNNDLVYPNLENKTPGKIVKSINDLKEINELQNNDYNYFLDSYVIPTASDEVGNLKGISTADANTFRRLEYREKNALITSFLNLFGDPATHSGAMDILHYMMVKDGLQLGYKSLVNSLSPQMMSEFLDVANRVQEVLGTPELTYSTIYNDVFGESYEDTLTDFLTNYGSSRSNMNKVKKIGSIAVHDPNTKVRVSSKVIFSKEILNNSDTLYIFYDNEAGAGLDRQALEAKNSIAQGAQNVKIINIGTSAGEQGFYIKENETKAIEDLSDVYKEIIVERGRYESVVIQNYLSDSLLKGVKKNSPKYYNTLNNALSALGQSLKKPRKRKTTEVDGKKITKITVDVKKVKASARDPRKSSIYLDKSNANQNVITIDAQFDVKSPKAYRPKKQAQYRKVSNRGALKANIRYLTSFKFNQLGELSTPGMRSYQEAVGSPVVLEFPSQLRMKADGKYKIFQLVQYAGPYTSTAVKDSLYEVGRTSAVGTYAKYVEVPQVGSAYVSPLSWIYGETISTNDLAEYSKMINEEEEVDEEEPSNADYEGDITLGGLTFSENEDGSTFLEKGKDSEKSVEKSVVKSSINFTNSNEVFPEKINGIESWIIEAVIKYLETNDTLRKRWYKSIKQDLKKDLSNDQLLDETFKLITPNLNYVRAAKGRDLIEPSETVEMKKFLDFLFGCM